MGSQRDGFTLVPAKVAQNSLFYPIFPTLGMGSQLLQNELVFEVMYIIYMSRMRSRAGVRGACWWICE